MSEHGIIFIYKNLVWVMYANYTLKLCVWCILIILQIKYYYMYNEGKNKK